MACWTFLRAFGHDFICQCRPGDGILASSSKAGSLFAVDRLHFASSLLETTLTEQPRCLGPLLLLPRPLHSRSSRSLLYPPSPLPVQVPQYEVYTTSHVGFLIWKPWIPCIWAFLNPYSRSPKVGMLLFPHPKGSRRRKASNNRPRPNFLESTLGVLFYEMKLHTIVFGRRLPIWRKWGSLKRAWGSFWVDLRQIYSGSW